VDQLLRKPFSGRELIATVTALVPAEPPVTKRGRELRPIRAAAGRPIASVPATRQP